MKNYFLILFLFIYIFSNAQDTDPNLFNQTWYLYEVNDSEGEHVFVENWYPDYAPYVIIDEFLNFNGVGLCNTFNGVLEQEPNLNNYRAISSDVTSNSCGDPFNYESLFIGPFGYVEGDPDFYTMINLQIVNNQDGFQTLTYITQPFIGYLYRNTPILSVEQFDKNIISFHPNPTKGKVYFSSERGTLKSITILSISGKLIFQSFQSSSNSIDLSSLENGIYIAEIVHSEGKGVYKILKD